MTSNSPCGDACHPAGGRPQMVQADGGPHPCCGCWAAVHVTVFKNVNAYAPSGLNQVRNGDGEPGHHAEPKAHRLVRAFEADVWYDTRLIRPGDLEVAERCWQEMAGDGPRGAIGTAYAASGADSLSVGDVLLIGGGPGDRPAAAYSVGTSSWDAQPAEVLDLTEPDKVFDGFTDFELRAAFRLVRPAGNWKLAISADVPAGADLRAIEAALIYYTGSETHFTQSPGGGWHVAASGYYANIGS